MRRKIKSSLALLLAFLMFFEAGQAGIVFAAEEIDRKINPAEHIELTVPDRLADGGNWFFIPEASYTVSEKSTEKLYIPIQRTGDLDVEAEVTLKVVDLSAHHDVNYSVEVYKDALEPELIFGDLAIVDLIQNADGIEEIEPIEDTNDLGALIYEAGGAELVDGEGNTVATVTATPLDQNGNPVVEEPEAEAGDATPAVDGGAASGTYRVTGDTTPGEVEEGEWTEPERAPSATERLRAARNAYTGTTSDRQELKGSDDLLPLGDNTMTEDEYNRAMADAAADNYPGKEYRLTFAPGEAAKFLVVTPLYSPAAEGDAQIILMLKAPGEGYGIGENVNPVSILIRDEDAPEPVYVDMAADTVIAENGVAVITVNRSGRINTLKGVTVASWDGSAKQGDEYSGIGAKLYFSMGLTTRSVQIPVYHGTEQKDFYVTITALSDEQITRATTHVIIPAAEVEGQASLMGISDVAGHPLTSPVDLSPGSFDNGGLDGNTAFHLSTSIDKQVTSHYWMNHVSNYGYAYDGIYVHYNGFLDWCKGEFRLLKWNGGNFTSMHKNYFNEGGKHDDHWLYGAWDDPKAPDNLTIEAANTENYGWIWTDSYAAMWVDEVRLIKRQFEITAKPPEVLPLIGMSDQEVLEEYEVAYLDGNTVDRQTHWTDDSFSFTAKTKGPLRLVGVEAQTAKGEKWVRIATTDGKSSTVVVPLTADSINSLQAKGVISWSQNGTPTYREEDSTGYSGSFYKGSLTVRPVFDYIDVDVEVQEDNDHYGSLSAAAPTPMLLWDFNADNSMNGVMRDEHEISLYKGISGDGTANGYYQFEASGGDPYVFFNTPHDDAKDLLWVKIRARSVSGAKRLQLFAECLDQGWYGDSCESISLNNDGQWHEYIHQISNEKWKSYVNWIRLDPLDRCASGDRIDIDYIAFFPNEASAKAYQSGGETGAVQLEPGMYTYHLGDRLSFSGTVNERGEDLGMVPDGVQYELRAQGSTGSVMNSNTLNFINGAIDLRLAGETSGGAVVDRPYYKVKPTFRYDGNSLVVNISEADYEKLDPEKGILAEGGHSTIHHADGVYRVVVANNVHDNDIYSLAAFTKDGTAIPIWTLADGSRYSGTIFYAITNPLPEENVIVLTVPDKQKLGYVIFYGTVSTSTFNMNTSRSAGDNYMAEGAWVSFGEYGAWTNADGNFELRAVPCVYSSNVRFLVDYNGITCIKEAIVPGRTSRTYAAETHEGQSVRAVKSNAGTIKVESFSETGVHFESAFVQQDGRILGAVDALALNAKRLTVEVKVAGGTYMLNGKEYVENIQEVALYFMDQSNGDIHGSYSSNATPDKDSLAQWAFVPDGSGGGTFTLDISQFKPELPNDWNYGDVLMARVTTDKRSVTTAFTDVKEMNYDPVSTGYAVISDPSYEPQTFDYDIDDMAALLNVEPASNEDGELLGDGKRASFGAFPYIGAITATVHVFSILATTATTDPAMQQLISNLEIMGPQVPDEEEDPLIAEFATEGLAALEGAEKQATATTSSGAQRYVNLSILVKFDETFYGGVRFMFGAIVSGGGGPGYKGMKNPMKNVQSFRAAMGYGNTSKAGEDSGLITGLKDPNPAFADAKNARNSFGGAYFSFHVYIGIYVDFGYIELRETDENGMPKKSHDAIYMGIGGFLGVGGTIGYTFAFALGPLPAYINVEAGMDVSIFLGSTADPNKTLGEYEKLEDFRKTTGVHGQDFSFNFDFKGRIYASGSFGVGVYKVLGVRITVELVFEFAYSNKVMDWFPQLFDSGWGYVMEAGFSGTIDLLLTSIDVYSASWPLPVGGGFLRYMQEVRRANKCINYVEKGIEDGHGTQADREAAYRLCLELEDKVDSMSCARETLEKDTTYLKNWAYEHSIITWTTKNAIEMNKQGGLVGTVLNAVLQEDGKPGLQFRTRPHVHSSFVGNDAQLMAAYGPVRRTDVVTDAFAQPSSKIMAIGNGRYLMVYLDDTSSRDKMQAATLTWTVYDANDGSFTTPRTVQSDQTADSRPNLTDAGDKVVLSWASATDKKYEALKAEFAAELKAKTGAEPSPFEVQEAMEADPARVMSILDIFTAEFDKAGETFGSITQLTDDAFYDDNPQGVYDKTTGDVILLYTKTAQDDEKYSSAGEKLLDLVGAGPSPDKTYSVIGYRLYNGTREADDPFDAGWIEGFYPNELPDGWTSEDYLRQYGPERYLPSTIRTGNGEYTDPPISDLTVCAGLDHLAAFAFTVDRDFNLETAEDRELYMQYYNFATHSIYVPIRVAGDKTVKTETYNPETRQREKRTSTVQVEVGAPKLVRNGGSTFLFWRENGQTLNYLNVSEMLNAKVAGTAADHDGSNTEMKNGSTGEVSYWKYAVGSDGAFAVDAGTGEVYTPNVMKVDFGSAINDPAIEITEYEVITDEADNLYVVWTDSVARKDQSPKEDGGNVSSVAKEIYASAMIRQEPKTVNGVDEMGGEATATVQTVRWSKPYRITRDDDHNDGVALAVDPDGGLIIVHNRYSKLTASSEDEVLDLVKQGKIGVTQDKEGNAYAASLTYNSPVTLSVTRCDKIGSLEATLFSFDDVKPVAGETVKVTAAIENVGLIDAEGCEVEFYEYKDGVRGSRIYAVTSEASIPVNTAKKVSFRWTVPAEGPVGYSIQAVIREKKADGGYYDPVSSYSDAFTAAPDYYLSITDVVQEGDQFRVSYRVANRGNAPAEAGTGVCLELQGLYGDLSSELYGRVKDNVLYTADISDKLPAKTVSTDPETGEGAVMKSVFEDEQYVTIPASVFRFCGYDAIVLKLTDARGNILEETSQKLVAMAQPMNLNLNDGKRLNLSAGESIPVPFRYDTTAFIENRPAVYTVADPNVAEVDADGTLMGVSDGTTTLTATLLPSGRSVTVPVTVNNDYVEPETVTDNDYVEPETVTVKVTGDEGSVSVKAAVEGNTAAVTAPTEAQLAEITDRAGKTGKVIIDLSSLPESVTAASIPAETVKAVNEAMEEGGESLTIRLPNSTVTYDAKALASVAAQTGGKDLKLCVEPTAENRLNGKQQEAIGDLDVQAVYNVYMISGGKRISDFGGGTATIEVSYPVPNGKNPNGYTVWYVADTGGKTAVPTSVTRNTVKWTVTHFSTYVLAYDETHISACPRNESCPMTSFTDLDKNAWYHDGVHWALEQGVMNGVGNGLFDPAGDTSRAMLVTMLYRLEGAPKSDYAMTFADVAGGQWYTEAVRWAAENGIVTGYDAETFGPTDQLTREQLAAILCRYARYKGVGTAIGETTPLTGFTDMLDVSEWAIKSVRWAVSTGIINGVGDNTLSPKTSATRAQVATMLMRYDAMET